MKKTTSEILAFLLLLSALLTGCGNGKSSEETENQPADTQSQAETVEAAEETEEEITDNLPAKSYGGGSVKVKIYEGSEQNYDMVTEDEEIGETLHDAVYRRNRAVEERYDVAFEVTQTTDTNTLHASVMAQSDDFELLFYPICYSISLSSQGDFLSTEDLPYVDLDKPWWDGSLRRDLSINGNLFFLSGDISPSGLNMSSALLFNKNLFTQLGIEYPYDTVREGKWTLDSLASIISGQTTDVDGDGEISSAYDSSDRFGLTGWMWSIPNGLYYGSGERFVNNNSEGTPVLDFNLEKTVSIYEKIYDILISKQSYFAVNTGEEYDNTFRVFSADRSLLLDVKLYDMSKLRDMESDFGVLPIPKYDEAQDSYYSFVNNASNMISVPKTVSDPEKCSIILEAMASESYKDLTPSFKEAILKGKYSRDRESGEMVDIIIRSRVFDIAYIYGITGFGDLIRPLIMSQSTSITSTIQSYRPAAEAALEGIVKQFLE